jgi:hypothetical protein
MSDRSAICSEHDTVARALQLRGLRGELAMDLGDDPVV